MASKADQGPSVEATWLLAIVLTLFLVTGFSSGRIASAQTRTRFLHLAPGLSPVQIWVDGGSVVKNLAFKQHTEYIQLSPEEHRIISKTKTEENPVVLNSLFPFRSDKDYTVLITGRGGNTDLQLNFAIDSCPPSKGMAQIKFTNAIGGSPPATLSIKYGPSLYRGLSFRTSGGLKLLPPGDYTLSLAETETGELMGEQKVSFQAGTRYNLFAATPEGNGGVDFMILEKKNVPKEPPKIYGVEKSVLQIFGAGLIASLVILVLGR